MPAKKNIFSLFLLLLIPFQFQWGLGQLPTNIGNTYLETFQNKCGNLEKSQIWSITPGNEGYVFFASNNGLGVYDGVRWETYNTKEGLTIRSLYFDTKTGTLYCGSVNQFGKWTQDKYGKFEYTLLWKNKQKNMYMEFWRIKAPSNGEDIYIQSHQAILKHNITSKKTDIVKTSDNFTYMYDVAGNIWVQEKNNLFRLDHNNELIKIIQVEDRIIQIIKNESDGRIMLFLEHKGIFVLSNDFLKLTPLNTSTNTILSKAKIFTAMSGKERQYLIGTTRGGLYILDQNGTILKNVGEQEGLPTTTVLSAGIDNRDNIWMGLDGGVATLDTGTKDAYYTPKPSIGTVRGIIPIDNSIYIGTNQGLFKLDTNGGFSPIESTSGSIWSMYNIGGVLFFNHDLGLFQLKNDIPVQIKEGGSTSLVQSLTNPDYLVGGDYYGLSLYKMTDGEVKHVGKIKDYAGIARHIQFDKEGYLWITIPKEGFFRITLSQDMQSVKDIKKFNMPLSNNKDYLLMLTLDDHLVFYDGATPYFYDPVSQQLREDESISGIFRLCGNKLISLNQFDNVFWYQTSDDIGYVIRKGSKLEKYSGIFSRIYNKRVSPFITKLDGNIYSIGFQNGIAFSDTGKNMENHLKIRMVEAYGVGEPDYYDFSNSKFELPNNKKIINIYPVNLNANHLVEYRILELDSVWVKEKIDNFLTLTHLESGLYTIQLRNWGDKDGHIAQITAYIALPWYVSTPMICVYLLALGFIVFMLLLYVKRKNEKEKRRIERVKQAELQILEKENLVQSQRILELEKENLTIELQEKDKRLAFITMNGVKRNNLMNELKKEIQEAEQYELSKDAKSTIKKVIKKIENELDNNEDWEIFEKYFNVVFGGLLEKLAVKYPQLTQGDLRLLAYLKLNLNNKEIANLLNISFRSVEMSKYRLRKKLNLDTNDNFGTILNEK